jgi:hypothetical protein
MNTGYLSSQQNASAMGAERTHVTITHPHHPLNGQKCELIKVRRGPNPVLVVKMPDGNEARLPRDWTDYDMSTAPDSLLPIEGLRELIKIIGQLDEAKSSSTLENCES